MLAWADPREVFAKEVREKQGGCLWPGSPLHCPVLHAAPAVLTDAHTARGPPGHAVPPSVLHHATSRPGRLSRRC